MRSLRVSIINWTGDRDNWGCQATSYGLLEDLQEAAEGVATLEIHKIPLGQPGRAEKLLHSLVKNQVAAHLQGETTAHAKQAFRALTRTAHGGELRKLAQADLVIFMAEGTMTGTGYFRGNRTLLLPHYCATVLGKPVVSLNQTIFSQEETFTRALVNIYKRHALVSVREPASLSYAQTIGLDRTVFIPDSAFRTHPSDKPLKAILDREPHRPLICLTASGGLARGIEQPHLRLAFEFARDRKLQVCGLSWQSRAIQAMKTLGSEAGGPEPVFPIESADYRDISAILAASRFVIGGRYHTSIQAAAVGTPFIALPSETHKTEGLLQLLSYPLPVRAYDDLAGIQSDLELVTNKGDELSAHLNDQMNQVKAQRQRGINLQRTVLQTWTSGKDLQQFIESSEETRALRTGARTD